MTRFPAQPDPGDAHTAQPSLEGRKALITGGTTGIGRAIAVLLASYGARVFVCGRDPAHLRDALERIAEVGEGSGSVADVSNPDDLRRVFDDAATWLGGLDIVVINAAIPAVAAAEMDQVALRYALATDFTAYIASAHLAAGRMGSGADIVLIGSMSAHSNEGGSSVYVAAKAGIGGFARALRRELAEKDIKVGLIEPGFTGADFQYPKFPYEKQAELTNAEQMLRAEDIAVAAHFMLTQPRRSVISQMRVEPRLPHG